MKRKNAIFNENFSIGFYGVPTETEKVFGGILLAYLKRDYQAGKIKHTERNRLKGFMTIGSAISNIKLETTCSKEVRNAFIKELYNNLDGVEVKAIWLDVEGAHYTTFVFKNEDIKCLFP